MTKRYQTSKPFAYGELELLAGITDREQFWRGKSETQARSELHGRIEYRIAVGDFTPCWPLTGDAEKPKRRRKA